MEKQALPISVYAEMTPNPAVLKFVANKRLVEEDSVEFKNIEEAQVSPLAVKLFHFPFIKEVFISANYVALTKYDIVEWEDVTMELRELVREHLAEGLAVLEGPSPSEANETESEAASAAPARHPQEKAEGEWDEIDKKIVSLLDEYVKPAVTSDGGNIKFLNHQEGVVSVLLQGACSGCPSSTATLKGGIEQMLQQFLPGQIKAVQAVNG